MTDPTRIELYPNQGRGARDPLRNDPLVQRMRGVTRHGYIEFDEPFITHVGGNLYVGGCRTGLVLPQAIKHVVSLYPWERYTVTHQLDSELYVRMYDTDEEPVDGEQVREIARWARERIQEGPTLIHCQAGLNRSNLIAATALAFDMEPQAAIDMLRQARGPAVLCNKAFEEWLLR